MSVRCVNVVECTAVSGTGGADVIRICVSRPRGDVTMIEVTGEIDLCTAPSLRENLVRAFGFQSTTVVVDLSPVTFFAAAGVTALIEMLAEAEKSARRVFLIANGRVGRVLQITGLPANLHCADSLAAALDEGYEASA
ncbi:STAS domain-containing protein [Nocardia sp. KC 131]|uniref:STAS domain-containing protein n=1 Tax=Nocardia arseniciresistens TaxID=3392119 RepID=UPI00398F4F81